jgi:hypothetical protein
MMLLAVIDVVDPMREADRSAAATPRPHAVWCGPRRILGIAFAVTVTAAA